MCDVQNNKLISNIIITMYYLMKRYFLIPINTYILTYCKWGNKCFVLIQCDLHTVKTHHIIKLYFSHFNKNNTHKIIHVKEITFRSYEIVYQYFMQAYVTRRVQFRRNTLQFNRN